MVWVILFVSLHMEHATYPISPPASHRQSFPPFPLSQPARRPLISPLPPPLPPKTLPQPPPAALIVRGGGFRCGWTEEMSQRSGCAVIVNAGKLFPRVPLPFPSSPPPLRSMAPRCSLPTPSFLALIGCRVSAGGEEERNRFLSLTF